MFNSLLLLILPAGILVGLVYLALSKTSPPALRRTALITLIFIIAFLLGLIFWLLGGSKIETGAYAGFSSTEEINPVEKVDYTFVILFLLILILFIGFIVFDGFRSEQKRKKKSP